MRVLPLLLSFTALSLCASKASAQVVRRGAPHQTVPSFIGWVSDEFVVEFDRPTRRSLVVTQSLDGAPLVNDTELQALLTGFGVERFRAQFIGARPQPEGGLYPDLTGYYKIKLPRDVQLEAAMAAFEANPKVDHVEKIGLHSLYGDSNDPYYRDSPNPDFPYDQWHYYAANGIAADQAWDAATGDPSVLVGILDSGVRYYHRDLGGDSGPWGPDAPFAGGNIFINPGEVPGNGVDDDGNGYIDDTVGWDFIESAGGAGVSCIDVDCSGADNDPDDGNGHGTHVAGTVGAITNNGYLVAGVAGGFGDGTAAGGGNGVGLVSMRIGYHARYQGRITGIVRMDAAAEAMNYIAGLVDAGHNVASINCSWGSSNSGGLAAATTNLVARDVLVVVAAGNSNSTSASYLGSRTDCIDVSATDQSGSGASFTNHGSWVDVAAPGVDIMSTYSSPDDPDPNANYIALLDGTSMAAPHIAAMAAVLESCTPSLTMTDKWDLIVGNTNPYSDSRQLGSGIADLKKALDAAGCGGTPCDIVADFGADVTGGCASLVVNFTDLSTGGATGWSWDFGDGNSSQLQSPQHAYGAAGSYTVSLTASNETCSDSLTRTAYITVSDTPVAEFSADTTSGFAPLTVSFSDGSSGNPTGWTWDFGDSNGSSDESPSHTYTAPGVYTVTLTTSNSCGSDSQTKIDYITVSEAPPVSNCYVGDIVVTKQNQGAGNKRGVATVTIVDDLGDPVADATVTGNFSGKTSDVGLSGTTDANGQVTFFSSSAKGGGEWCFEVTVVTHSTLDYDASGNAVTQSCEGGDVF